VRGAFIMGLESLTSRMSHLARGEIRRRGRETVEQVLREYEAVTEDEIRQLAGEILAPSRLNLVALGPIGREGAASVPSSGPFPPGGSDGIPLGANRV